MIKRKAKTALVFNPSGGRSLTLNGAKRRPAKRSTRRRSNPVHKTVAVRRRRNPVRKSNPITSISALIATATMAGVGVSLFDIAATYLLPNTSGLVRIGVKCGGAWAFNAYGQKVPVLGKYRNEIALVMLTSAAIDLMKLYLFPVVARAANQIGLSGGVANALSAAPSSDDGTTGGLWGEAFQPAYMAN